MRFFTLQKLLLTTLVILSSSVFSDEKINWAGPYMGIKAGYSQYENKGTGAYSDDTFRQPNNLANIWNDVSKEKNNNKAFGGFEAGYNWQKDRLVYGLVADLSLINSTSHSSGTRSNLAEDSPLISGAELDAAKYSFNRTDKMKWLSTVRGKVGYETNNFLPYVTGGIAFAKVKNLHQNVTCCPTLYENDIDSVLTGWTLGAGLTKKIKDNLSLTLEGLYTEFPDKKGSFGSTIPWQSSSVTGIQSPYKIDNNIMSVTLGLNYQF
jgi:outer membrane immunogenic protein